MAEIEGASEAEDQVFGRREGWTMRQRFIAADSYGLLLPLIILSLFATAFSDSTIGEIAALTLQGGTLLYALYTSRARRGVQRAAIVLIVVGGLATALTSSAHADLRLGMGSSIRLLLALAAFGAILKRLTMQMKVSGETLLGAMSLYLLLGLMFSALFGLIGAIDSGPFFAGMSGDGSWPDRLYFSYTTMTTVGYGDFTAAGDVGRMSAISEALMGQLYLVSVVSIVVANLGRARTPRAPRTRPKRGPRGERAGEDSNLRPAD
jgi:hypothetical protein